MGGLSCFFYFLGLVAGETFGRRCRRWQQQLGNHTTLDAVRRVYDDFSLCTNTHTQFAATHAHQTLSSAERRRESRSRRNATERIVISCGSRSSRSHWSCSCSPALSIVRPLALRPPVRARAEPRSTSVCSLGIWPTNECRVELAQTSHGPRALVGNHPDRSQSRPRRAAAYLVACVRARICLCRGRRHCPRPQCARVRSQCASAITSIGRRSV